MSNSVKINLSLTENVSKKLRGVSKEFDKLGGRGSGASLFGNVGAKGVAKGFDLIGSAADGAIGFLKDSVLQAREAEVSETQLATALTNNVKGWDGSTQAIEDHLNAQLRLGFSDDEQRNSMTRLITATGNVAESERELAVAMDVARFKHISLADATDLVIKATHGNTRALKALGIQMPKNATASEILDAITRKLTGSAEAYSTTLDGKVAAANARLEAAQEKLGKAVTPALVFALDGLSNILMYISGDPTYKATGALKTIEDQVNALGRGIMEVNHLWDKLFNITGNKDKGNKLYYGGGSPSGSGKSPAGMGTQGGVTLQGISQADILRMVDEGLYFKLRRAGTAR